MSRHQVSDNLRKEIISLHTEKKLTYSEIAGMKGITRGSVAGIIDRWKKSKGENAPEFGEKTTRVIAELQSDPFRGSREIAKAADVSEGLVRSIAGKQNIKIGRPQSTFLIPTESAKWIAQKARKAGKSPSDYLNALLKSAEKAGA